MTANSEDGNASDTHSFDEDLSLPDPGTNAVESTQRLCCFR